MALYRETERRNNAKHKCVKIPYLSRLLRVIMHFCIPLYYIAGIMFVFVYLCFFLRSPFQAHTFLLVYMRDTLLSISAPRRRSISDFSCTCGTRRRPVRGQILGPLGHTTCTLPNELTVPITGIMLNPLSGGLDWIGLDCLMFNNTFNILGYIEAVSFIGGGNRISKRKPPTLGK